MLSRHKQALAGPVLIYRCPECGGADVEESVRAWHGLNDGRLEMDEGSGSGGYYCSKCGEIDAVEECREPLPVGIYYTSFQYWENQAFNKILRRAERPADNKIIRAVAFMAWDRDQRCDRVSISKCLADFHGHDYQVEVV